MNIYDVFDILDGDAETVLRGSSLMMRHFSGLIQALIRRIIKELKCTPIP